MIYIIFVGTSEIHIYLSQHVHDFQSMCVLILEKFASAPVSTMVFTSVEEPLEDTSIGCWFLGIGGTFVATILRSFGA